MYGYSGIIDLNRDEVLRRVSQEDIFGIVMEQCSLNEYYCSPFREDSSPGAFFDWHKGKLHFIDFGDTNRTHRDCFNVIQDMYGIGFKETLELINEHFSLGLGTSSPVDVVHREPVKRQVLKKRTDIIYRKRPFMRADARYWQPYGITSDQLMSDKVFAVLWYKFFSRRNNNEVVRRPRTVTYVYTDFDSGNVKVYTPHAVRKWEKWISNCGKDDIGFINELPIRGDKLTITKSYKDARVLRNAGLHVIWLQNEGVRPDEQVVSRLGKRFDKIFILFDNDVPGMKASQSVKGYINSIYPGKAAAVSFAVGAGKDAAQYRKDHGQGELMKFIVERNMI